MLAPILFLVYINGIQNCITNGEVICHVEEPTLMFPREDWGEERRK